jgi:hypothetical protein
VHRTFAENRASGAFAKRFALEQIAYANEPIGNRVRRRSQRDQPANMRIDRRRADRIARPRLK